MDLFKFTPTTTADSTLLQNGQPILNWDSVMWVERYLNPGEFEIKAPLSTGLRDFLPLGTLISHIETLEVMIVENHEIIDENDDPTLSVTGRSLESYLENRIVGQNLARSGSAVIDYILAAGFTYAQAVQLINDHIKDVGGVVDTNDALTNVQGHTLLLALGGVVEERTIPRGNVHEALVKILQDDDLGVRSIRRNSFSTDFVEESIDPTMNLATLLRVYIGQDRTKNIHFTWFSGDFDKLQYLFSLKTKKTSAMVVGRWAWTIVDGSPVNYNRRLMLVDASDLDNNLSAMPSGGTLTTLLSRMAARGRQALRSQQQIAITGADVSNETSYIYRKDYNLGDLVTLDGNYGQILTMRVVEYAEIEDENGRSGHPTLAVPGV